MSKRDAEPAGDRARVANPSVGRRSFLRLTSAAGAAAGLSGLLAACGGDDVAFTGRKLVIAFVGMQSGALAAVGEADAYVISKINERLAQGIQLGGRRHPVEIVAVDNQSDQERAALVTEELLNRERVDIVLATGFTFPVAGVCERHGVPCLTTLLPFESHYLARQQLEKTKKPSTKWAFHFFWGLRQGWEVYMSTWQQVPTNKVVGLLLPKDPDGVVWADPERGFGRELLRRGFERVVSKGLHEVGVPSFREDIKLFQEAGAEIVTGLLYPPDFATFWKQCDELGYRPKIVTMGRALLSPSFLEAVQPSPAGASTDVWWSPMHPYRSSLTGQTAGELAAAYSQASEKQWIQPMGFTHALIEVAVAALENAGTADDPGAITEALADGRFETIVGRVDFTQSKDPKKGLPPNTAQTPLVGGQWREGSGVNPFELDIVSVGKVSEIPTTSTLEPLRPAGGAAG